MFCFILFPLIYVTRNFWAPILPWLQCKFTILCVYLKMLLLCVFSVLCVVCVCMWFLKIQWVLWDNWKNVNRKILLRVSFVGGCKDVCYCVAVQKLARCYISAYMVLMVVVWGGIYTMMVRFIRCNRLNMFFFISHCARKTSRYLVYRNVKENLLRKSKTQTFFRFSIFCIQCWALICLWRRKF